MSGDTVVVGAWLEDSNATGINVIYDSQFQDRLYSVALDDVTIEEALDLILTANGYFYKVLSPRSVAVSIR